VKEMGFFLVVVLALVRVLAVVLALVRVLVVVLALVRVLAVVLVPVGLRPGSIERDDATPRKLVVRCNVSKCNRS